MRYLVEVPATFELVVVASSHEQAKDFADVELFRVVELMASIAEEGSPEQCITFDTRIEGQRRVTSLGGGVV